MDVIEHRVRERAYYIWEDEGRVHGRADAHWLRAEAEVAAPAPILTIEAVAATGLAPSPAKTLKPRASRAKAVAKPAEVAAKPVAKTISAKASASKTSAPKTPAFKTPASKTAAPKAPKALAGAGLAAKPKSARAATGASLH
ncbi:DUF2934 domain-containing protein [Methylobacterium sp. WL12]|uniref:DUF2934 domain-containing protein n=1 Tax=Methylobacterium sp. WL12 TaxID=2603890 RepID=UPI0011C71679|nr:DUF2934 domain-containing protein [Methylobacterium sp. WL12]TXM70924.1 DUF2934 domain-containing protein [Methylobacterium sp. WL12]